MEFEKLLNNRFSVRSFSNKVVEKNKITKILEAARLAPSARNLQPTRIIVVQKDMAKMEDFSGHLFGCNVVFIVCIDETNEISAKWGKVDAGIAATHMVFQAQDLGLGTTIIGTFDNDGIRNAYKLPECYEVAMLLICGYPSETVVPRESHFVKKPLNEMMFLEDLKVPYEK